MPEREQLEQTLESILATEAPLDERLDQAVKVIASAFEARTCTFLETVDGGTFLNMRAQVGLPPHLVGITERIPVGKGMAGICAQRKEPVTVCNLQADDSGVARPAAKDTKVAGALVVPLLDGDTVLGTLGVGKPDDYDYSEDEIATLEACGNALLRALS